jgi:hypothetical protein
VPGAGAELPRPPNTKTSPANKTPAIASDAIATTAIFFLVRVAGFLDERVPRDALPLLIFRFLLFGNVFLLPLIAFKRRYRPHFRDRTILLNSEWISKYGIRDKTLSSAAAEEVARTGTA